MAIILDGILSEKALRATAGDDLYERGEGHVEAVCVHSLAVGGATATVGGEALCDVHLFWHDDVITGVCTCPRFSDRGFCEHMVAVGLAVLDDVRDGAVVPASPSGAFAAPPAPADSGPAPRGGRARTATPDPGAVKDIGAELLRSARSLTVVRRFLRPGEAARYARSIERFLDGLESFPADRGGPDGAAPALLHIATRLRAQLETRIDDSGGNVTRACQRAIDLYARACREGRPNGVRLGRRLAKFRLASPGWPDVALNDFLPALGGKGVAAYRRAVDAAAEQAEAQGDRPGFELGSMLLELADLDGDVDRAVELLSREEHPRYAAIIERLVAAGRRDEALARLDRAVAESRIGAPGPDPWRDADNPYWVRPGRALDLYLEAGRSGNALDLARDLFHSDPGPASLDFLLATAERLGRREEELDSALTWVDGRDWRTGDTAIALALHLGDVDRAWAAADRWGVDLAWMSLADVQPQPRPDDAIELYRRDIERALLKAGRPSARRAAAAAVRMRLIAAAADARDGGGRVEAFTAWVGGLRETHRRRPTVGQEFDREGL
ncbi:SWIM zinc finger family protein [Actinomyces dentalis]|uniref:SWIM zinc finger family protein n=1 Tax=Actinomyces dentalis TaxID=272548 RepID=UPI002352E9CC|nr:hypothetical protein [Actinomyces dentalis]